MCSTNAGTDIGFVSIFINFSMDFLGDLPR